MKGSLWIHLIKSLMKQFLILLKDEPSNQLFCFKQIIKIKIPLPRIDKMRISDYDLSNLEKP